MLIIVSFVILIGYQLSEDLFQNKSTKTPDILLNMIRTTKGIEDIN